MKKVLFITLVCIITSNFLYAQKGYGGGVNFAYHMVWTLNQNAYGDLELDEVSTFHPAFGIHGFYNFSDMIGVWLEINKVTLGQKYEDIPSFIIRDIKMNYLAIPIMAKYTSEGDMARFHFMIGPELAFLTKATQVYQKNGSNYTGTIKNLDGVNFDRAAEDIKDRYIKMDFMLAFDIGADISLTENLILNGGVRANYGFRDINAEAYRMNNKTGTYTATHNTYFGLQVGVSYFLGTK
jgi:hypothetical protein